MDRRTRAGSEIRAGTVRSGDGPGRRAARHGPRRRVSRLQPCGQLPPHDVDGGPFLHLPRGVRRPRARAGPAALVRIEGDRLPLRNPPQQHAPPGPRRPVRTRGDRPHAAPASPQPARNTPVSRSQTRRNAGRPHAGFGLRETRRGLRLGLASAARPAGYLGRNGPPDPPPVPPPGGRCRLYPRRRPVRRRSADRKPGRGECGECRGVWELFDDRGRCAARAEGAVGQPLAARLEKAPRLWWTHDHGEPALYTSRYTLRDAAGCDMRMRGGTDRFPPHPSGDERGGLERTRGLSQNAERRPRAGRAERPPHLRQGLQLGLPRTVPRHGRCGPLRNADRNCRGDPFQHAAFVGRRHRQ